jgi:hypothetical protein
MALVTHTIQNLMNGVSQQPPTIRLSSQCKEQINATCRVSDGLSKRLAVELKAVNTVYEDDSAQYLEFDDADCRFHTVADVDPATGEDRVYQLIVHGPTGAMAVQFIKGEFVSSEPYLFLGLFPYLQGAKKENLRFLTNGKKTYVLNKNKIVDWKSGDEPSGTEFAQNQQGALGYVAQGFFGTTYSLKVNVYNTNNDTIPYSTSTFTYTTNSSSATTDLTGLQTSVIANGATGLGKLLEDYVADTGNTWFNTNTEVVRDKNWFQIKFKTASPFPSDYQLRMEVSATTASTAIYGFNGICSDPVKLPVTGPEGYTMRIDADPTSSEDQYYLVYQERVNGWVEGVKKGKQGIFDEDTLPLIVDMDFGTVETLLINSRTVGDDEVAPHPSFLKQRLNDMFIFNNRLGFLSQNNLIMSKIDDFQTFYRSSVASNLASDRVDLTAAVPSTRYSNLNSAVPFETALMLFGDSAQYLLNTNVGFDVTKTSLQTSNEYDADTKAQPLNIGSSIYFNVKRGEYSGVFDLSRKDGIGLTAEEATHHVPTYIKGQVIEMAYSSIENMVFVRTLEDPNTIYVQNRFVRQTVLEQNAWHKWTTSNPILHMQVVGSHLYLTLKEDVPDATKLLYCTIDIATKRIEPTTDLEIEFIPHLDLLRKLPVGSEINSEFFGDNDTYYPPSVIDDLVGININGGQVQGLAAINLALEDEELWVGVPYKFQYTFSEQVPSQQEDRGKLVYQYGRLILRSMKISYSNTGRFDIKVKPTGRPQSTTSFSGLILGAISSVLGKINISTGVFKFPVNARSNEVDISIESTYPYPCTFNTCEWNGTFTNQAGRM